MKKFKKVLAMGLAVIAALSVMSIGVFADDPEVVAVEEQEVSVMSTGESIDPQDLIDNKYFLGLGEINYNGVNLRTGPSTSYKSLGKMYNGDNVAVYGDTTVSGPWYYVYVHSGNLDGEEGYVHSSYVTINSVAGGEDVTE